MSSTTPGPSVVDVTAVHKEVFVAAAPELAFDVFTTRFADWWPGHHLLDAEIADYVLEPFQGGRWFERATDGRECDWGRVLAVEPPKRLVLSWAIGATWQPDPPHASEVEVTFTAVDGGTHVVLEHRHLDRAGEAWRSMRDSVAGAGGWGMILGRYADVVRVDANRRGI